MKYLAVIVLTFPLLSGCTPAQRAAREKAKNDAQWEAHITRDVEQRNARSRERQRSLVIGSRLSHVRDLKELKARINRGEKTYQGRSIGKKDIGKIDTLIKKLEGEIEHLNATL